MHPDELPQWKALTRLAAKAVKTPMSQRLRRPERFAEFSIQLPGLLLDYSKQRLDVRERDALLALADACRLPALIDAMFSGAHVNNTENRPALHTALRAPVAEQPPVAQEVVGPTLARIAALEAALREGRYRGHSDRAITDIVHIGIGGSHLGPELLVEALARPGAPRCHFVANVDGDALRPLATLNPETTLFVVVSKSFGTLETRVNAESARSWFLERVPNLEAIGRHFLAVTANVEAATAFGIPADNIYPLWDWVGGRFSLWSAVGVTIALVAGYEAFEELLRGAHDMDTHFRTADPARNGPLLMALLGIWNSNFLGATNHAVLPYGKRLRLLPPYLQQLEMESNGKGTHKDGTPVRTHTMSILWGGEGTNGQHAFHQLLHQGTRSFSADFILCAENAFDGVEGLDGHHRWLLANALAQGQAMMSGQENDDPHRSVSGDKPTSTLVLDRLSPHSLGALLALYEHKVFCQGAIWDINSFDQWGVELGKRLAQPIFEQLGGRPALGQDASTRGLIDHLRRHSADDDA